MSIQIKTTEQRFHFFRHLAKLSLTLCSLYPHCVLLKVKKVKVEMTNENEGRRQRPQEFKLSSLLPANSYLLSSTFVRAY